MTNAEIAKKIRQAIFDQAEADGRVMHGDSMDAVIEKVLAAERPAQSNPYGYGFHFDNNKFLPCPQEDDPVVVTLPYVTRRVVLGSDCQGEPVIWGME